MIALESAAPVWAGSADATVLPHERDIAAGLRVLRIADIQVAVCDEFHVTHTELLSRCRDRRVARPRQIAMYLSRRLTTRSLPEIGRIFGRDHTTVLHAVRAVPRFMRHDGDLTCSIARIAVDVGQAVLTRREALGQAA